MIWSQKASMNLIECSPHEQNIVFFFDKMMPTADLQSVVLS